MQTCPNINNTCRVNDSVFLASVDILLETIEAAVPSTFPVHCPKVKHGPGLCVVPGRGRCSPAVRFQFARDRTVKAVGSFRSEPVTANDAGPGFAFARCF